MKHTKKTFLEKAKAVHGDKFDYSLVQDEDFTKKGSSKEIKIICPVHGEFVQSYLSHLGGRGCIKCGKQKFATNRAFTEERFLQLATADGDQ